MNLILSIIFALLGVIHFYWAGGGMWAIESALPSDNDEKTMLRPPIIASFFVGAVLMIFAAFYFAQAGYLKFVMADWMHLVFAYGIPSIFILRVLGDFNYVGLFKKIRNTKFAKMDTLFFIPLCAFIGIVGFFLALT